MHRTSRTRLAVASLASALALSAPGPSIARSGTLDWDFGGDGVATADIADGMDLGGPVAVQRDGRILVGGFTMQRGSSGSDAAIARFTRSGSLDRSFGKRGAATVSFGQTDQIEAIGVARDKKIVVVGSRSARRADGWRTADIAVARFTPSGKLDKSFGGSGKVLIDIAGAFVDGEWAVSLAIQKDGRILIAGSTAVRAREYEYTDMSAGHAQPFVMRIAPDGSVDRTFGQGGLANLAPWIYPRAVAIHGDGILIAGAGYQPASRAGNGADLAVARLTEAGSMDLTFGTAGITLTDNHGRSDYIEDVAITGSGRIVAAGSSVAAGSQSKVVVARYTSAGALDPTFSRDGLATFEKHKRFGDSASTVSISGGNLIVGAWTFVCRSFSFDGMFVQSCGPSPTVLAVRSSGTLDRSFSGDGWIDALPIDGMGAAATHGASVYVAGWYGGTFVDADMALMRARL